MGRNMDLIELLQALENFQNSSNSEVILNNKQVKLINSYLRKLEKENLHLKIEQKKILGKVENLRLDLSNLKQYKINEINFYA
jgi:predicted nuclease with TOPRIM domain